VLSYNKVHFSKDIYLSFLGIIAISISFFWACFDTWYSANQSQS